MSYLRTLMHTLKQAIPHTNVSRGHTGVTATLKTADARTLAYLKILFNTGSQTVTFTKYHTHNFSRVEFPTEVDAQHAFRNFDKNYAALISAFGALQWTVTGSKPKEGPKFTAELPENIVIAKLMRDIAEAYYASPECKEKHPDLVLGTGGSKLTIIGLPGEGPNSCHGFISELLPTAETTATLRFTKNDPGLKYMGKENDGVKHKFNL